MAPSGVAALGASIVIWRHSARIEGGPGETRTPDQRIRSANSTVHCRLRPSIAGGFRRVLSTAVHLCPLSDALSVVRFVVGRGRSRPGRLSSALSLRDLPRPLEATLVAVLAASAGEVRLATALADEQTLAALADPV